MSLRNQYNNQEEQEYFEQDYQDYLDTCRICDDCGPTIRDVKEYKAMFGCRYFCDLCLEERKKDGTLPV